MERAARLLPVLLLLLLATALPGAGEPGSRTFTGQYRSSWENGPLEAHFTPDGDGRWRGTFDFRFNRRPYSYSGTAEGRLSEGELRGRVKNETGRRTFTFRGEFENGRFSGTHSELRRGGERRTGTLTLEQ